MVIEAPGNAQEKQREELHLLNKKLLFFQDALWCKRCLLCHLVLSRLCLKSRSSSPISHAPTSLMKWRSGGYGGDHASCPSKLSSVKQGGESLHLKKREMQRNVWVSDKATDQWAKAIFTFCSKVTSKRLARDEGRILCMWSQTLMVPVVEFVISPCPRLMFPYPHYESNTYLLANSLDWMWQVLHQTQREFPPWSAFIKLNKGEQETPLLHRFADM